MEKKLRDYCNELEKDIQDAYEQSVTMSEAEKLAAKFLGGQIRLSSALAVIDLDRRMKKRGVKAIKSAVRMEEIKKHDKKPTEGFLDDTVNLSDLVNGEEQSFDEAEVEKEEIDRMFGICHEAHIFFRGVSRGSV